MVVRCGHSRGRSFGGLSFFGPHLSVNLSRDPFIKVWMFISSSGAPGKVYTPVLDGLLLLVQIHVCLAEAEVYFAGLQPLAQAYQVVDCFVVALLIEEKHSVGAAAVGMFRVQCKGGAEFLFCICFRIIPKENSCPIIVVIALHGSQA